MSRLRRRTYEILENATHRPVARVVNRLLIGLIILNVAAIVLASVTPIGTRYHVWFLWFEWISIVLFTLEYVARAWAAVERPDGRFRSPVSGRIRYMLSPLPLVDLLAILPFYLAFLVPVDLRFMRIFRLFLIFKLTRYHASMSLLTRVVRNEARPIAAALFVLVTLLMVAASFAFIAEHEAQPEKFASIPDAMWWAIVTMTTVGYGDMVPVTPFGKLVGAVIAVIGLGMVALPAGLLASGFSEQLHVRKRAFEDEVHRMLQDGVLSEEEHDRLKSIRDRLGLTDQQAGEIMHLMGRSREVARCPHCGHDLRAGSGESR
ncbi:MAG TPA: ion transporter [Steroidobacteraceae bacterium]|jgi:voltage-gated potassium channel|nr:ion transporter [Steroidobacteraceae bacterium]